ncbi:endoglucanase [Natronocella acetinitrilica]|uniref:cellulase n=1 Tax=Natronocella acetinitrilica TaxID=414046 RepID=A0AAE3G2B3_9GAMM|nr:glycosyl hydrolase family 8 [Natronocella acetinitrilica]MCP1674476.1 endoglucanase [Natronocella acetinitrilica]
MTSRRVDPARLGVLAGVALALALLLPASTMAGSGSDAALWERFKERFVTSQGRVVDTENAMISHSEGQGYAMLLAVHFNDQAAFAALHRFTREALAVRPDDRLHAWSWSPASEAVSDANAAADGDLLIAWALLRAAERFGEPALAREAEALIDAITTHLVREQAGLRLLVPGPEGFVHDGVLTLNPSYWITPAFSALGRADPAGGWEALAADAHALITRAIDARTKRLPDWFALDADGAIAQSGVFDARSAFDAVRIPLYLIWGCERAHPALEAHRRALPAPEGYALDVDLDSGQTTMAGEHAGYRAIDRLTRGLDPRPARPATDYYPAVLELLALVAHEEEQTQCP